MVRDQRRSVAVKRTLSCGCALVLSLLCSAVLQAEAPAIEWFKGQGTDLGEHVHEGCQTSDGGYVAIGQAYRDDEPYMLIVKVDSEGNLEWQQTFGGAGRRAIGYCVAEVPDGYIVGGNLHDPSCQRMQRFLAKLDCAGKTVWQKFYGAPGISAIRGIDITSDGGIVATGYASGPDIEEFREFIFIADSGDGFVGFIMKLDAEGNVEWEKPIDAPQGTKVREIGEGYAICSCVWTENESGEANPDFCLMETDDQGNTLWRKTLGGSGGDHLYDFDLTKDGGYILGGHTVSYGVKNWDYLLMKVDGDGNEEWHKTFGQPRGYDARYIHDEAYGVRQTPDGGYIIAGGSGDEHDPYSGSGHPNGTSDEWKVYLVRTDGEGNVLWEGIYPATTGRGNNAAEYVGLTSDGGYIVFVDTDTQSPPERENYGFLKIAPDR
jgi:hypothetical protein